MGNRNELRRASIGDVRREQSVGHIAGCGCSACLGPGGGGLARPAGSGVMPVPASMLPSSLLGPNQNPGTAYDWYTAQIQAAGYPVVPYANDMTDMLCMTPVSSGAPVAVAIGASALITIGPTRGWFDMFYLKIVALNAATGLEVDPASYRITPPRVADCPQPCDTTAMRGAFWRGNGEECCGCPFRALVGRNADGEALTFTFTNDGIAAVTVQAVARGFCHARNLCLSS